MRTRGVPLALITGLVFCAALVGIVLRTSSAGLTEIWIANAVAFGLISHLLGNRWSAGAAAAFLGCLLANLAGGLPLASALFFASAFLLELSIALMLHGWLGPLWKAREVTAAGVLATIGVVGAVAPALAGVVVTAAFPLVGGTASGYFFWIWWSGAAMGAVAVLPLFETWPTRGADLLRGRSLVGLVATVASSVVVTGAASMLIAYPYIVATTPLLIAAIFTSPFVVAIGSMTTIAVFVLLAFAGLTVDIGRIAGVPDGSIHVFAGLTVIAPLAVGLLVNELRRQNDVVRRSETRWAFALESARQGVWDRDFARDETYVSPIWLELLGLSPGDIGPSSDAWLDHVHPDDIALVRAADEACLAGLSDTIETVIRMRHKDGRWLWILDLAKVVERDAEGRPARMIGTHLDVTRLRELEQEQRILLERTTLATKAGGVGIFEWSLRDNRLTWDDQMLALYGAERSELSGCYEDWADHLHPDDREAALAAVAETVEVGKPFDTEFRIITGHGEHRVIRALATRLTDADGSPLLVVGTNWDVTETRAAAESLRLANESLGQFAAVASHDLQAPLRHMSIFAEILDRELGGHVSGDVAAAIEGISASTAKMQSLVRNLLAFSRTASRVPAPQPTPMNDIIGAALANLGPELQDTGGTVAQSPLPTLDVDPHLMEQVFQNLIGNALKYRDGKPPIVEVRAHRADSAWEISVTDNGIGIDPRYAELVFEPFKRLPAAKDKPGVGIGLSLVRRILHAHGASIRLDEAHVGGSRFVLTFPAPTIVLKEAG